MVVNRGSLDRWSNPTRIPFVNDGMAVGKGKAGCATDVSGRNIAQMEVAWRFVGAENAVVDAIRSLVQEKKCPRRRADAGKGREGQGRVRGVDGLGQTATCTGFGRVARVSVHRITANSRVGLAIEGVNRLVRRALEHSG